MKLPPDTIIDPRKITHYLLRSHVENDKSKFLAQAGYITHAVLQNEKAALEIQLAEHLGDQVRIGRIPGLLQHVQQVVCDGWSGRRGGRGPRRDAVGDR